MKAIRYPLTVFYDASCPMCANEIVALKERDLGAHLELVDCSAPDFDQDVLAGTGITRIDLMSRIHARDAHGRWLVALDAIEAAYRAPVGRAAAAGVVAAGRRQPGPPRHRTSGQSYGRILAITLKRLAPSGRTSGRTTAISPSAR